MTVQALNYVNNQPFRFIDRLGLSLVSWFREIFNRPKCEKAGGQYVGGNCCCMQQIFNPDKSCCISEEIHSKQGEAVAFVYKDYISDKLDGGFNERGVHYWLEWDGNRIEANPSNNGLGTVYYIPSAPLIINPDNFPVFYFDDPSTDGNKTSAKQPFRTEYLSKCDGYDVRKFKDCLHKHAKQDNGKSTKMLCYDYIDNLISICKQEQHNERAK